MKTNPDKVIIDTDIEIIIKYKVLVVNCKISTRCLWSFLLEYWKDEGFPFHRYKIPITGIDGNFKEILWDESWNIVHKENIMA